MTAPVHFIELYADRGEIAPRLVCTATPDAPCRRRPVDPDVETWTDEDETTPGHDCWTTEFIDGVGFDESVMWDPESGTIASVPVHVSYDHRGVLAEPVVLPDPADLLPMTADGTPTPRTGETITTAAELDALPVGSVVMDGGTGVARKTYHRRWSCTGYNDVRDLHPTWLPVTVLFRPDAPQPATTDDAIERAALTHARAFVPDVQEVINDDAGDDPDPQWVYDRLIESLAVIDSLVEAFGGEYAGSEHATQVGAIVGRAARAALAAAGAGAGVDREALAARVHGVLRVGLPDLPDGKVYEAASAVADAIAARGDAAAPTARPKCGQRDDAGDDVCDQPAQFIVWGHRYEERYKGPRCGWHLPPSVYAPAVGALTRHAVYELPAAPGPTRDEVAGLRSTVRASDATIRDLFRLILPLLTEEERVDAETGALPETLVGRRCRARDEEGLAAEKVRAWREQDDPFLPFLASQGDTSPSEVGHIEEIQSVGMTGEGDGAEPGHTSFPAANCAACRSEKLAAPDEQTAAPTLAISEDQAAINERGAANAKRALAHHTARTTRTGDRDD